jgi:hypothetical protein
MVGEHYVESDNLSVAWGHALRLVCARGRSEVAPLIVAVTGFDDTGKVKENAVIRAALDGLLVAEVKQSIDTVANTIFPISLWDPMKNRSRLYERYLRIVPRLRKASPKNRHGIYFERMLTNGPTGQENQLEFAIGTYLAREGVRRSVLQIGVFDPNLDHSAAAQRGFPCLQHVTFAPTDEGLCVNAFYATQYLAERAYGNYVGLCRLGRFVAHELALPLVRLTCVTGIAELDMSKAKLAGVLAAIDTAVNQAAPAGA